jgi:DNA primase
MEVRIPCFQPECFGYKAVMYVNLDRKLVHCQHCKYSANLLQFIHDFERIPYEKVVERLCSEIFILNEDIEMKVAELEKAIDELESNIVSEGEITISPLPPEARKLFIGRSNKIMRMAENYLCRRGVTDDQIDRFDFYFAEDGLCRGRIIMPAKFRGNIVTYSARDITGKASQKYYNPPGGSQSCWLFNWDTAEKYNSVIVVEGVFDALGVDRAGYKNVVASFTKRVSEVQAALLSGFKKVIIMYDNDAVDYGQAAAESISTTDVRVAVLKKGDPGDAGSKEISAAIRTAARLDSLDLLRQRISIL